MIHATKGVTLATAKAVAAGNSSKQEDIVQAANVGQRHCTELLAVVKVSAGRLNFSSRIIINNTKHLFVTYKDRYPRFSFLTWENQELEFLKLKVDLEYPDFFLNFLRMGKGT